MTEAAVKMRCGGETADAFPSTEQLAGVISACHRAGVRLKATAGLHHPVRRPDPATGAMMHGFFNVVIAALLLQAERIPSNEVDAVLRETDESAFVFSADAVGWRDARVTATQVQTARTVLFSGFGSCSIDEPVDDLTTGGLWPESVA
jgi:hypothetical protein